MDSAVTRIVETLRDAGCQPKRSRGGWAAKCPAHEDSRPSLSVSEGHDGRTLVHCHAGCTTEAIVAALGLRMPDLMPPNDSPARNGHERPDGKPTANGNGKANGNERTFTTAEKAVLALAGQFGGRAPDHQWMYHNATGEAVGVVCRWNRPDGAKDIRPIRRNPDGTWSIGAMPAPRPLYNLPAILKADPDEPIFVLEGEKATDAALRCGLVATTSSGGAQAAGKTDWTPLAGRHVIVIPDNDEPGERYADEVAKLCLAAGAKSVRVLRLAGHAPDLPISGDLADVLESPEWCKLPLGDSATPEDLGAWLRATAEKLTPVEPEPGGPMVSGPKWHPFPVHVLPSPVREFVLAASEAIGCDPTMIALPTLAVLARCVGNRRVVQLKVGWCEPAVIWSVVIAPSGGGKTPGFDAAMRVLERRQRAAHMAYLDACRQYEADLQAYERAMAEWRRSKASTTAPERPEPPRCEKLVVADITVEALVARLAEQTDGVLIARDELAGWVDSFNAYKNGRGGDTAHWLACWNARPLAVERKMGTKSFYIPRAAVSVCGGIPPDVFRRALAGEHQRDGLCSRLLVAMPPERDIRWREAVIGRDILFAMEQVVDSLLALSSDIGEYGPEPRSMGLTPEAKQRFVAFYNEHRQAMRDMDDDLRSTACKLEAYAARFALIFASVRAVLAGGDATEVDVASMEGGIELARWFLHEAQRVHELFHETPQNRDDRRLLGWLERRGGTATVREVQQGCRWLRASDEASAALERLAQAGLGRWEDSPVDKRGGRPTRRFALFSDSAVYETPKNPEEIRGFVDVDTVDSVNTTPPTAENANPMPPKSLVSVDDVNRLFTEASYVERETCKQGEFWGV